MTAKAARYHAQGRKCRESRDMSCPRNSQTHQYIVETFATIKGSFELQLENQFTHNRHHELYQGTFKSSSPARPELTPNQFLTLSLVLTGMSTFARATDPTIRIETHIQTDESCSTATLTRTTLQSGFCKALESFPLSSIKTFVGAGCPEGQSPFIQIWDDSNSCSGPVYATIGPLVAEACNLLQPAVWPVSLNAVCQ